MLIKVIRKKDGFILEMPPFLANDKKYLEKNGLFVAKDEVKKPEIQDVVDSIIELDKEIISHNKKEPVKRLFSFKFIILLCYSYFDINKNNPFRTFPY